MLLVSAIIPFYNSEKYISEAINSVLSQSYKNFEIICVNNNSTDRSVEIVNSFIIKYPNQIKLYNESRPGANYARNTGVKYANGTVLQFLDSDDIILPDKFSIQVPLFIDERIDVVVSDRAWKDETLSNLKQFESFEDIEKYPLNVAITKFISTGNPLYKRSIIDKIGGWSEDLPNAQDWELNIRAVLSGANFKYVKGLLFVSRFVENSISYNWIKVSHTCTQILISRFSEINDRQEKLSHTTYSKVFYLFYLTSIYYRDESPELIHFIKLNIPLWKKKLNFKKRLIAFFVGLKGLIIFERIMNGIKGNNKIFIITI